jgi:hypothetical protein
MEPIYRAVIAQYQTHYKVFSATPTGQNYHWFPETDIFDNPPFSTQIQPFDREHLLQLVDVETMTDPGPVANAPPSPPPPLHRPLQPIARLLPTFRDITNPAMLQAVVQPDRIHSVDFKKKTAVVSYPTSLEKSTLALPDLMALNPELLAAFLVQSSA